jgi:hypothetical protein
MLVTLFGIVMLVRPEQPWNTFEEISVTLLGMVMLVREVQPRNAELPIYIALEVGVKVTEFKLPQFLNISFGI